MKKIVYFLSVSLMIGSFSSCGESTKKEAPVEEVAVAVADTVPAKPEYTLMSNLPQTDISAYKADKDSYITLFDGKTLTGWRGYNREDVPGKWTVDGDAIKINGGGEGEAHSKDGGDIIFAHKFKNFELSLEWKVAKGSNSGIFYLAQEIKDQPIYISAPECQVLDNVNHNDATKGVDGNRQSSSLYDMIPAKPQNSKPFGEWNKVKITVYKGSVFHEQNGVNVVEYHLWTPQWTEMLKNSKFKQGGDFPIAFDLLNNCGGENHEGYIGLQDHGDDVWFKNIKIKILD